MRKFEEFFEEISSVLYICDQSKLLEGDASEHAMGTRNLVHRLRSMDLDACTAAELRCMGATSAASARSGRELARSVVACPGRGVRRLARPNTAHMLPFKPRLPTSRTRPSRFSRRHHISIRCENIQHRIDITVLIQPDRYNGAHSP